MARFSPLSAVALGGMVGTLLRWWALSAAGDERQALTLIALNGAGSLVVGGLVGAGVASDDRRYLLVATGFAGGLTTFSTFAVDVARSLDQGALGSAIGNTVTTVLLAVLCAGIGYRLGAVGRHRLRLRMATLDHRRDRHHRTRR